MKIRSKQEKQVVDPVMGQAPASLYTGVRRRDPAAFVPMEGRGGARTKGSRASCVLAVSACRAIIAAAHRAVGINRPLNRFATIHWEAAGVGESVAATGRWLKMIADWLRTLGEPLVYVWVREDGLGKGDHVHIMLHVPPRLVTRFNARQRAWLRACGAARKKGVIKTRAIGGSYDLWSANPRLYDHHLRKVVVYVLKGACLEAARRFDLGRAEEGGWVIGKRSAVSRTLGQAVFCL
jgi:hypothetical protein